MTHKAEVRATLLPGQKGTVRLQKEYGDRVRAEPAHAALACHGRGDFRTKKETPEHELKIARKRMKEIQNG